MKKQFLFFVFLSINLLLQAQVSKTVNVTAGGLSLALTTTEKSTITNLTVTGSIDARDFKTIRDDMPVLAVLDLSAIAISEYTGTEGTMSGLSPYDSNLIPHNAFYNQETNIGKASLTSIIIPSTVTSFGHFAFYGCTGLTSISIPSSVTSIGHFAFADCTGLTSINIPSSVTSIGDFVFRGCTGLTSISIPSSVTSIGNNGAFWGCTGLTSINIPSSVTSIGYGAFRGCTGLTSINIPSSVTSIGGFAFYGCSGLTSISIPSSVTSIGVEAFEGCTGLTSINIPSSMTSIGVGAFIGCIGLTSINIPSTVTSIGDTAFADCTGLTSINIPSSMTSIGVAAFYDCSGLTSINIPSSVTSIGVGAFQNCSGLTSIYAYPSSPVIFNGYTSVFSGVNKTTCILYVPIGTLNAYRTANQWRDFTKIVEFDATAILLINTAQISLYPNPVTDGFRVSGIKGMSTISIFDMNGKLVLTKEIVNNEYVSVNSMPKGVYLLRISSEAGTLEKKIMKN